MAQTVLPPGLLQFMQGHPNVRIDLRDMDSAAVAEELTHDRADIGLASIAPLPHCRVLNVRRCFPMPLVWSAAPIIH